MQYFIGEFTYLKGGKMNTEVDMNNGTNKLSQDEKKMLKSEIKKAWNEFPIDMKKFILETKKEKLKALYMIEGWAKENGHQTIVDLISRKIAHKEEKIKQMETEIES
jgi:hypothetical protein